MNWPKCNNPACRADCPGGALYCSQACADAREAYRDAGSAAFELRMALAMEPGADSLRRPFPCACHHPEIVPYDRDPGGQSSYCSLCGRTGCGPKGTATLLRERAERAQQK